MLKQVRVRVKESEANLSYTRALIGRDKAFVSKDTLKKVPLADTEKEVLAKVDAIADGLRRRLELRKLIMDGESPYEMPSLQ